METNDPYNNNNYQIKELTDLIPADKGRRFVNFIIDYAVNYLIWIAVIILLVLVRNIWEIDLVSFIVEEDATSRLLRAVLWLTTYVLSYTFIEGISKGRSLGKLITGTIAIKDDGTQISLSDAFKRSLCRLIPFDTIIVLAFEPWHDTVPKTKVVRKSTLQGMNF